MKKLLALLLSFFICFSILIASAETQTHSEIPLVIVNMAHCGTIDKVPYLTPYVENINEEISVTGFTLAYYLTNEFFSNDASYVDPDAKIEYRDYEILVKPKYTDIVVRRTTFEGYEGAKNIYMAISKILMEDGTIIEISHEDRIYNCWTIVQ